MLKFPSKKSTNALSFASVSIFCENMILIEECSSEYSTSRAREKSQLIQSLQQSNLPS